MPSVLIQLYLQWPVKWNCSLFHGVSKSPFPFPPLTFRACPLAQHHQHGSGRAQPQLRSVSAEGVGSDSAAQNNSEFCCFGFNAASDVLPTITTWRTTCSTAGSSLGAAQDGWSCAPCCSHALTQCSSHFPTSYRLRQQFQMDMQNRIKP